MTVYYLNYYKSFHCLADKCRHSCCVGWEIYVDSGTLERYDELPVTEREEILSHIGNDGCICLAEGERCPFLRGDGLCRIIADHGEQYTSQICREHPRFYHRAGDRVECGIGLSCEEAARVVLISDEYDSFFCQSGECCVADETDYDTLSHREYIYSCINNEDFSSAINIIKEKYSLSTLDLSCDRWNEALCGLEYLDPSHREVIRLCNITSEAEQGLYSKRFFAYLIFRHLSVATSFDNLRARLGFCLLLLRLFNCMAGDGDVESAALAARIISEEIEYSEDNTDALILEMECLV